MAVSSGGFHFCRGTVLSLHLSLSGCKCAGRLIGVTTEEDFTQCTKTGDKTRVNSEGGALFFSHSVSPSFSLRLFKPFHLYSCANQWQTSVYCLFCAQATALLQHPPLQKCFFPSVPLLITSRVTLNFLCPGRRDTSLNSHNYSSSPLTI